jgi:plastocyanin
MIVAGCGKATTPAIQTTPTTTVSTAKIVPKDITIANFQFSPTTMEIAVGETAQRINNDTTPHEIVADDNSFQSPVLQVGESFNFTFTQAGTYAYHCQIHPSMKGTIMVK